MAEYHELVAMLKWLIQNKIAPRGDYVRGLLGNGHGKVQVPSAPDHSYVRPNRSVDQVFEIFNKTVPFIDGLPVLMGEFPWMPGLTQIIDVDWETYLGSAGWAGYSRTGPHGETHVWRDGWVGADPLNVYRRSIAEMRTYPVGSGSASVYIAPYDYLYYGEPKSWPGLPALDLSPAIPATGTSRWMLTYLDARENAIGVVTGTIEVDSIAVVPDYPGLPTGSWVPSAYVRLYGGQGTISERDIRDARPLWITTPEIPRDISVDTIQFNASFTGTAHSEGLIYWDATDKTLLADMEAAGVKLQIGQEQYIRGVNKTGAQIDNGTVVYISGAQDNRPSMAPASAWVHEHASHTLAMATHDVPDNQEGYFTTFGLVRDLDTSAYSAGDVLWLATGTPGSWTNEQPEAPVQSLHVGHIVTSDPSEGIVFFRSRWQFEQGDQSDTYLPTGTLADGDILEWSDANHRWEAAQIETGAVVDFDSDDLMLVDFQRLDQQATGTAAGQANYVLGSGLELLRVGAAGADPHDRGTINYEAGRWPGTMALLFEKSGFNWCTNPVMRDSAGDTISDGFSYADNLGSGGSATTEVLNHPDKRRKGWLQRFYYTAAAGDVTDFSTISFQTSAASMAPSDDVTFTVALRADDMTGCTLSLQITASRIGGLPTGSVVTEFTVDSKLKEYSITYSTLPALTDYITCYVQVLYIDDGDSFDLAFGEVNIEKTAYRTSLIHGYGGEGYSYTGTPFATASVRNENFLVLDRHVDLVNSNDTLTFISVFRVPYDYDATWSDTDPHFWKVGAAASAMGLKYDTGATRFEGYVDNGWNLTASVIQFSAGDWIRAIVTYDWSNDIYRLYINGTLEDTYTGSHASGDNAAWRVGSTQTGTQQSGAAFAEYVVLNRVLTTSEVSSLEDHNEPFMDFLDQMYGPTVPTTALASLLLMSSDSFTDSSYAELSYAATGDLRWTFAGLWARGMISFEAALRNSTASESAYTKLQYYDRATSNWRDVAEGELVVTNTTPDLVRAGPLHVPLQECEYRLMGHRGSSGTGYLTSCRLMVKPMSDVDL
jgi:hypothetical protein